MADITRDELFEHHAVDAAQVRQFGDVINATHSQTSWETMTNAGNKIVWHWNKPLNRAHLVWQDSNGTLLNVPEKFASLEIQSPPGPVAGWFVDMDAVCRFLENDLTSAQQKVKFFTDDVDAQKFPTWVKFVKCMTDLLVTDRCKFLVEHAEEIAGTYLTKHEQAQIKKKVAKGGVESAVQWLVDEVMNPRSSAHHETRWWFMKHKLFRVRKQMGPELQIHPADEKVLAMPEFDPSGKVRAHMSGQSQPVELDLLPICLPGTAPSKHCPEGSSGTNLVQADELGKLGPKGCVASQTLVFYSMYMRPSDGQHTVTGALKQIILLTNGQSQNATATLVDSMAILRGAKRQRTDEGHD